MNVRLHNPLPLIVALVTMLLAPALASAHSFDGRTAAPGATAPLSQNSQRGAQLPIPASRQADARLSPASHQGYDSAYGAVASESLLAPVRGAAAEARGGTYVLRDAEGQVVRSGRTNDLLRRQGEHFRDPKLRDYDFDPIHRTDVYSEQRGLEQLLHEQYAPPLNKINPISPTNPNRQLYLDAAEQYLNQGAGR